MGQQRDFKEVIGALMRCVHGGEISEADVHDLGFEADGGLEEALNAAYITLLDFALDQPARRDNPGHDRAMRERLQGALDRIIVAAGPWRR